jgi:phenylalanyl-tRNA synthetase beta chain
LILKVTLNWLKEFLDTDYLDPYEVAEILTMSGTEVKKVENIGERFKNMVVGEIISFEKHPDADKLTVCRVNSGKGTLNVVCGATNFKAKDKVVLALEDSVTTQGVRIKKSKLRGVVSEGMMCSEYELGISDESDGIMILSMDCTAGASFAESTGLDDFVLELEITPNRPDCLSIIGIAREISALKRINLRYPEYDVRKELNRGSDFEIDIKDNRLCPRYSAKIFSDIPKIDSPGWLKNRLMLCDYRPIDLIVDLTNFVMHEAGQPLHAFDKDLLYSDKIIIRTAKKDEKIVTIDDSIRNLDKEMLVIADEKNAVAVAGVMGGKDTEINQDTKNVLLESANFFGPSIMRTSKTLGLRSEASNRFEKKLDPEITIIALKRFEDLLLSIAGNAGVSTIYDKYKSTERTRKINLRVDKVENILGEKIKSPEISDILNRLKIKTKTSSKNSKALESLVPSFRYEDIEKEIDLIEEIARIYGFDKFGSEPPSPMINRGKYTFSQKTIKELRQVLVDLGLNEVINYSFLSEDWFKLLKLDTEKDYKNTVRIINPINEDFAILRTTPLSLMLKNVINNINHGNRDISIFEITKVFRNTDNKTLPEEITSLGIILSGRAVLKSWDSSERFYDYFDLKGILEYLTGYFERHTGLTVEQKEYRFFHPVIGGKINIFGSSVGIIGKIHPEIIDSLDIGQDIFYLELNVDEFIKNIGSELRFQHISAFPSVEIDLALVVDESINNSEIENEIKNSGTDLLKSIRLFDIYRGKQIKKGKKSMAYSLVFRDESRTLKDTEVDIIVNGIIENLKRKLKAKLRG